MEIGILDLGIISYTVERSSDTLNTTFSALELAEKLGFERYWFSEHHSGDVAWRNTDIMVALSAGYTDKIKIGSAGIILSVNNPYRIPCSFRSASAL